MNNLKDFYKGKKVLVTGHTGFKGAWLSFWLYSLGSNVIGYALDPTDAESIFTKIDLKDKLMDFRADIRDKDKLAEIINKNKIEIIFHLAAQPLVKESYINPRYTFEVNFEGTLNLLETLRELQTVKSVVIVTTDKVYENIEKLEGYKESDRLGGHDPYSSSKAATEILVQSYGKSFFMNFDNQIGIATARAGNVIGGGDWSRDRIVPDIFRSISGGNELLIRNPQSIRPWQHVLEPVYGYILLAKNLYINPNKYSGPWNFGPSNDSKRTVLELVDEFKRSGVDINMKIERDDNFHETNILWLNSEKAKTFLGWENKLNFHETIHFTRNWYLKSNGISFEKFSENQLNDYMRIFNER